MPSRLSAVLSRAVIGIVLLAGLAIAPSAGVAGQKDAQLRVSRHDHAPHRLLVKLRADAAPRRAEEALRGAGAKEVKAFKRPRKLSSSPIDNWRLLTFGQGVDLGKMRERLLKNPNIELVEYDYTVSIDLAPNDPLYPQLWGLNNIGQTGGKPDADIDAPEAWDVQTGKQDVIVAVIDSGVAYDHPDLAANVWTNPGEIPGNGIDDDNNGYIDDIYGYDFANYDINPYDDHGHGTHVSGTIAGVGNNGIGVTGVSWKARIMAVKFLNASGSGYTSAAIGAVLYAADNGARVMNNSWGGGGYDQSLHDAIVTADQAGALFVAAAGNNGSNNDLSPNYPSNYDVPNVLAVAATDHNDLKAGFSNYGATTVDLGAPGVNILSSVPTVGDPCCSDPSGYKQLSGTSMATPHVSGAAALLFAQFPGITNHQVKDRLMTSAEPVASMQGVTLTGGRLNILSAFENDTMPPAAVTDLAVVSVGGTSVILGWGATGDDGLVGQASSYDLRYSTAPISETNFGAATSVGAVPVTGPAGTIEIYTVQGLSPQTQYYFALKVRDNVGNGSALSNLVAATTKTTLVVFKDNFESGPGNWMVAGSDGVGGPALWHISSHRSASPGNAMYYGKDNTLTYDTGARNYGSITSVPINLSSAKDSLLSFSYFLATENLSPYDTARVQVSADNGLTWTDLFVTALNSGGMITKNLSLSAYDGQVILLRFGFDTVDSAVNSYEGWVVDDVTVSAANLAQDTIAPAAVTDLSVKFFAGQSVTLSWTAPGDDGNVGTASAYELRYSTQPIDPANPDDGMPVAGMPKPKAAGSAESFQVTGLTPGTNYFFVLRAIDDVGNVSPPSNIVSATTSLSVVAFGDDFEAGAGNWTLAGSDGVGGPALWHISSHRSASPSNAMYYGKESTFTYNTGARNFGSITSPTIGLLNMASATLSFNHFLANEDLSPYDSARVQISADNGLSWTDLYVTSAKTLGQIVKLQFNLDAYLGKYVLLRFNFDTVDAALNDFEGWVVDDVRIEGPSSLPPPPPPLPPIANAGGPYTGSPGKAVTFNGSGSSDPNGDVLTYQWNFGDGTSPGIGVAPTHTYAAMGSYTVTLVVSDGQFISAPSTTTVTIVNQPPIANAGGPYAGVPGKAVQFDGSGSVDPDGDPLDYSWDFGDGTLGIGVAPTHVYPVMGTYKVTLWVGDGQFISAPATATVNIVNQPPIANAGGPYTGAPGKAVQFDGSKSVDPEGTLLTYQWDFGDGSPIGAGVAPTHVYPVAGNYTATLVVNDGQFISAPATATVNIVNQPPIANAGGPYTVLRGQTLTLDGSKSVDPDGDPLTYQWDFGDGTTGTGVNPSHVYPTTGSYTVTLIVNDGQFLSAPATATVEVTNTAPVANAGGPYTVLRGQTLSFDGTKSSDADGDPLTYAWDFGDGTTGTGANPSHVYPEIGVYTVTLTVEDGHLLSLPATTTVTVTNTAPIANAGGPYTVLRGRTLSFDGSKSVDPDGDLITYAWDFGDGTTGTGANPSHVYPEIGVYTVTLTVEDGNLLSLPATATVTVTNTAPVANAGGPYTVLRGQTLSFDGTKSSDADGDPLTYSWDFGDGGTGTGVNPTHVYPNTGSYTVTLIVNDGQLLSAPATATVEVTNTAPVANAGGPYSIQRNTALSFDGSKSTDPDGDALTYAWNFGDGSTGSGPAPAHAYATSGTYTASLTVSDGIATATATATVTVTNQAPVASFTAPTLVYKNDTVTLNGSASTDADGDALTYRWDFGSNPQPPSSSSTATTSYATVGTRVLSLTVNDGEVDSAPVTRSITVQSRPPIANAGPDQTVLQRSTVALSAAASSDPDGVIANTAWRQVSGTAVSLTGTGAQTVSFAAPSVGGASSLTLVFEATVTDSDGVTAADQVIVTVVKKL